MCAKHNQTGREGEDLAAGFLKKKGYKILERNFRCACGEIDCIAQGKKQIVFVEVKTRRTKEFGSGLEAVESRKQKKLILAGQYYMQSRKEKDLRFDVLSIFIPPEGNPEYTHIENAFGAQ